MVYAVPVMLLMGALTWLWLQIMYMGLFRSTSSDAKAIDIGDEGERIATKVIESKYKELGPITWHESSIGFLFVSIVLLWFFRKPDFIPGWPSFITDL
jgi:sodium-dependent dicarboxylate transporter 2/3/5